MALEQPELRRLERVEVAGLFGIFDHRIDLNLADRVTLLHGPNGVGKTTVLKMVDALLTGKMEYFRWVPFERLALEFHDGAVLELTKGQEVQGDLEAATVQLNREGLSKSTPASSALSRAEAVAMAMEYLQRDGDGWIDVRDGEWLTDSEVVERYEISALLSARGKLRGKRWNGLENFSTLPNRTSLRRKDLRNRGALHVGGSLWNREWSNAAGS